MQMPSDERVDEIAQSWVPEAEYDWVWISLLRGAAERELNTRGHNQGHEELKRMVAAMVAMGVQAGDLDSSTGATRFVLWEDQSPSIVAEQISNKRDVGTWQAIGRCPDPGETGWLSKPKH